MKYRSFLVILALVASPSLAQNVLVNPTFDTGIASWNASAYASWDNTLDYGGAAPTNGSIRGTIDPSSGSLAGTQCHLVSGSAPYSFGGMVHPNDALTYGYVAVGWYSTTDCTGSALSNAVGPYVTTVGTWLASNGTNPVTSPATAQSAQVELIFANGAAPGPGSVSFDNVFFGAGTFPVALQRFSAE